MNTPNEVRLIRPEGLVTSAAFSHAAVVPPTATTVYVGGQNGVDADGNLVGADDVAAQTGQATTNVETALTTCGATLADVISWSIYVIDGADLHAAFGAVASRLDPDADPALVTVAMVAGLAVPGALVEMSTIAAVLP
ncbi:MAG: RidA family protein [Austwickia sp.]|jgi:enamine deaminase RidA (YjgF/YER057c/UK114 family)|nr:RidA family protein [Austwickia sp.]